MALPKRVRDDGHGFYKGCKLTVLGTPGNYVLNMVIADKGSAVNGITVIPDTYGANDYFGLQHLDENDAGYGKNSGVIAETIYNVGKSAAIHFDFPELRIMLPGHKFRLTYTNVAGEAMVVYTIVERMK